MGINTLQEIAYTTVETSIVTNLTVYHKTDSQSIFYITLNNPTKIVQWSTDEHLRLGVHDFNYLEEK